MPLKRRLDVRMRAPLARQQMLPFLDRSTRRQRVFKRLILGATLVVLASMIGASQSARARFNDGRFRVTTEAQLRARARFVFTGRCRRWAWVRPR